jgi:hypothetical protein
MLKNYFQRFKAKWNIKSNWQLTKVMIVFAMAGQSILFIMPLIRDYFGLSPDLNFFWKALFFIFVSFPIYQIMLLFWSLLFWEHKFFLNFIIETFTKTAKLLGYIRKG